MVKGMENEIKAATNRFHIGGVAGHRPREHIFIVKSIKAKYNIENKLIILNPLRHQWVFLFDKKALSYADEGGTPLSRGAAGLLRSVAAVRTDTATWSIQARIWQQKILLVFLMSPGGGGPSQRHDGGTGQARLARPRQ
jgi:hypothetical protein